jgi:TolB-like protein/Tfp pilus assembly protein PilF
VSVDNGSEQSTADAPRAASAPPGYSDGADVFISYAAADKATADSVCAALEGDGIACWIAPRNVTPGVFYADAIVQAINSARILIVVLSVNSVESQHVLREVERASAKRRPLVAFRIDTTALPTALEYFLSASHWLEASGSPSERALPTLVEAVRRLLALPAKEVHNPGIPSDSTAAARGHVPARSASTPKLRRNWLQIAAALAVVVLLALLAGKLWLWKHAATERVVAAVAANALTAPTISEKSIAVLPFADMSEKKDQEYFADGLSEELIDMLTKIPDLRVPARTSSFYFKSKQASLPEIAKALGVAHLLEGSVRKSGDHLRITADLVRVNSGYHLWSETYDRKLDDIFKVQDDIAAAVVTALKLQLLPAPPGSDSHHTVNADAYNQYLLGRNFYLNRPTRDGPHLAAAAYRKAIELDPGYALAYAGLAEAESLAADALNDAKGQEKAMADVEHAVALAPNLADGYAVRGHLRRTYGWDWVGAQADFEKALAINPGDSAIQIHYAELLGTVGRLPAAVAAARKAIAIDPLSELASRRLGQFLYLDGQNAAARQALGLALALNPESIYSRWHLGVVELLDGRPEQALAVFRQDKDPVFRLNGIALAEHSLRHTAEARGALDELIRTNAVQAADYQIAQVYAWRAEKDRAFEWLNRAFTRRDGGLVLVKVDPLLVSLHDDSRYEAFLRRMNLAQ